MVNSGIAFGLLTGLSWWVGLVGLVVLLVIAVKVRELLGRVGLTLIIIGGAINTYQRARTGYVIDNLPMFHFGYNNFADYLIFFGVLVYGYTYFVRRRGSGRN